MANLENNYATLWQSDISDSLANLTLDNVLYNDDIFDGDVKGNFNNLKVIGIFNQEIDTIDYVNNLTDGKILKYNGTNWVISDDEGANISNMQLVGQDLQITEDGVNFSVNLGELSATTYTAGNAINITTENQINANIDNTTIGISAGNTLQVKENGIGSLQLQDDLEINTLNIVEDINIGSNLTVGEDIIIEENLDVAGNVDIVGDLNFGGEFIITRSDFNNDNISTTLSNEVIIAVTNTDIPRTVTLPSPNLNDNGKIIIIKDESGQAGINNITIETSANETIDGESTKLINTNYGVIRLYSNGENWFIF